MLTARKLETDWLREQRMRAHGVFAGTPMPTTRLEDWRYTDIKKLLKLDAFSFAEERSPVADAAALPAGLRAQMDEAGEASARMVQVDASVVLRELPDDAGGAGRDLHLAGDGGARAPGAGAEALRHGHHARRRQVRGAQRGVLDRRRVPVRSQGRAGGDPLSRLPLDQRGRHGGAGAAAGDRGAGRPVAVVEELGSDDLGKTALSVGAAEIFADDGAVVIYTQVQRYGRGVVHLATDRLVAGRDARITTLYTTFGADVSRADVQCRMVAPGSHVDMLGLYIADGTQHFDNQTLQDHLAPHASSNLLFKGALNDTGRSVFRGLIRVHPKAQRTDAYQTNRNLHPERRRARGLAPQPGDPGGRRALLARGHGGAAGRGRGVLPAQPRHPQGRGGAAGGVRLLQRGAGPAAAGGGARGSCCAWWSASWRPRSDVGLGEGRRPLRASGGGGGAGG